MKREEEEGERMVSWRGLKCKGESKGTGERETFYTATVWETEGGEGERDYCLLESSNLELCHEYQRYSPGVNAPPNTHTSLALFAPPLKTQRNCRCPKLHTDISFTLCWKRLSSRPVPNPSVIIHIRPACAQTQPVRTNLLYWADFTGCLCNNLQNDLMWPYRDAKPNART